MLALALPLLVLFAVVGVGRAAAATTPSFPPALQSAASIQMPPAANIGNALGGYELDGGSTSCGSAGFCASVGEYYSEPGDGAFVVPITDGVPAPAVQVAPPSNASDYADVSLNSVSC